jgi:hypothetical protein
MKEKTVANQVEQSIKKVLKKMIEQEEPHFVKQAYDRLSGMGYTKEDAYHMLVIALLEHTLYNRDDETEEHNMRLKLLLEELIGNTKLGIRQFDLLENNPEQDYIVTFRVSLVGYEERIWRRMNIRSTVTLGEMSFIILASMQATMSHLYRITYKNTRFELNIPSYPVDPTHDVDHVMLAELPLKEGDTLKLDYDFGEDWAFDIVIESLKPYDGDVDLPIILDGQGYGIIEDMRYTFESMMANETIEDDAFDEDIFDYLDSIDLDLFEIEETEENILDAIMHYRMISGSLD